MTTPHEAMAAALHGMTHARDVPIPNFTPATCCQPLDRYPERIGYWEGQAARTLAALAASGWVLRREGEVSAPHYWGTPTTGVATGGNIPPPSEMALREALERCATGRHTGHEGHVPYSTDAPGFRGCREEGCKRNAAALAAGTVRPPQDLASLRLEGVTDAEWADLSEAACPEPDHVWEEGEWTAGKVQRRCVRCEVIRDVPADTCAACGHGRRDHYAVIVASGCRAACGCAGWIDTVRDDGAAVGEGSPVSAGASFPAQTDQGAEA